LLPLDQLGPHVASDNKSVTFGVFFPWVNAAQGNQLFVKLIHEQDQFIQGIAPLEFQLNNPSTDPIYGTFWMGTVPLSTADAPPNSHWGQTGRYVYRFHIKNPNVGDIDWIIDPFAREYGVGKISAFTAGYIPYQWSANESTFRIPALSDLVIYELNLAEFANAIDRAIDRLPYLQDLGINCIEVMPVSDVSDAARYGYWGYTPIGYFGVDERFGNRADFQRLVDIAHQQNIAVILDSVYGHTGDDFPYQYLYKALGYQQNPFMSGTGDYGGTTNFDNPITADFFNAVNQHWLDCYHVDGFRYDDVPEFWNATSPGTSKFGTLAYNTYQYVKNQQAVGGPWSRFFNGTEVRLIQCAEQLQDPVDALTSTYSNSTWQNGTLSAANSVAVGAQHALDGLGFQLGAVGYPGSITMNGDTIAKAPLQYIENHDHQRFVCNFGIIKADDDPADGLLQSGDRANNWFKVQPYLIGLLTSKGIPLLWQGQEFAENYWVPEEMCEGRVQFLRPTRWDYFYDFYGQATATLVRRLLAIRKARQEFRGGAHFFYNEPERYQNQGLLLFSRWTTAPASFSLVALNFTASSQTASFWFPIAGTYTEQINGNASDLLTGVLTTQPVNLTIPSNYGRIWSI
jgi:maltooligosyltrehalose trehalohydrolase